MSLSLRQLHGLGFLLILALLVSACNEKNGKQDQVSKRTRKWKQKYRDAVQEKDVVRQKAKTKQEKVDQLEKQLASRNNKLDALEQKLSARVQEAQEWEKKYDQIRAQLKQIRNRKDSGKADTVAALSQRIDKLADTAQRSAQNLIALDKYEKALDVLKSLREVRSEDPAICYRMAYCYEQLSSMSNATEMYRRAIKMAEQRSDTYVSLLPALYNNYGVVLMAMGQHQDALNWYQKAADTNTSYAPVYYNLGKLYMEHLENPQEAVAAFRRHIATGGNRSITSRKAIERLQKEKGQTDK